ncbi:uncharacterized protein TNCV_4019351 [Trichonephila clavipes]|nr:uncharacterized protein TNCV_4019351 [Trichonephila clavipes]
MVSPAGQGQVPHPSIVPEFFTINQLWNDRCTLPWGHCLLSELREWRRQTGRHNGLRRPIDNRRSLKIIMSSFLGFCEWNNRNRWHDGQVCPYVDKELWRLGPDSSGDEETGEKREGEKEREKSSEKRRADRLRKRRGES